MRSKAPLMLMEQMVMLLVFALAAALCLQAFVKADAISRESEARDHAVLLCQSVAEQIKESGEKDRNPVGAVASKLDPNERRPDGFSILYYEDWSLCDTRDYTYDLTVNTVDSGVPGLGKARVTMLKSGSTTPLFEVQVAWQEVSAS